jgi:hypothetical protein
MPDAGVAAEGSSFAGDSARRPESDFSGLHITALTLTTYEVNSTTPEMALRNRHLPRISGVSAVTCQGKADHLGFNY